MRLMARRSSPHNVCIYVRNRSCIADKPCSVCPGCDLLALPLTLDVSSSSSQPPSDAHVVVMKLWLGERDSLTDRLQCLAARVLFTVSSCLTPVPCCASYNCTDYWRYDRIPYITGSNTCAAAAAAHRLLFSHLITALRGQSRQISKREQNRFFFW